MKKTTLFLSVLAVVAGIATLNSCQTTAPATEANNEEKTDNSAPKGSIVYFNLDRVINEYDMANDLGSVLQSKLQSIDQEVTRRGNKLQSDLNAFQQQDSEYQQYVVRKQQEMQEEQAVTMNQIANAIKEYIDKFNEEKQYALIIATQGDILPQPIVAGDPSLDITDILIEGLNAEYVKTRNENN